MNVKRIASFSHAAYIIAMVLLWGCSSPVDEVAQYIQLKKSKLQASIKEATCARERFQKLSDSAADQADKKAYADSAQACAKQIGALQNDIANLDLYLRARSNP